MEKIKGIRQKLTQLILIITLVSLVAASACSMASMMSMRSEALKTARTDAIDRLSELAQNRATIADSMLKLAQNQTIMVAEGMQKILENADTYLLGYNEESLPNVTCATPELLGKYSVHVRVPDNLLKNIQKNDEGTVTYAEINREAVIEGSKFTVNQELYLASLLSNEFAQIERFRNAEGSFSGFSASYFCFDDSGLDILGDPGTQAMISYDGRTRAWYTGAVEAYNNGTLSDGGVFWTEPVPDGSGRGISMICAVPVVVNGKVVGVAGSGGLLIEFADLVESSKIGSTGYSFMVSRNTKKVIVNPNITAKTTTESEVMIENDLSQSTNPELVALSEKIANGEETELQTITIDGKECYLAYSALTKNDWTMVTVIQTDDDLIMESYHALNDRIRVAFSIFAILIALLLVVVTLVSRKFSKSFTDPIIKLKEGVARIGSGDLEHELDIKTGDEIEELGTAFNKMGKDLDQYVKTLTTVTAEKERIGAELDVAAHIQSSMLPCIFPAFPERKEIDIYATMNPAKEVGGDFYDFFMVDERHIAIVMADVSGKGVPAALFMVIGKTLIKDHTQSGKELGDVFTTVNNLLCEANSEGLFITAFEAVLDLVTGELMFVNAGHETPFIAKADAPFAPHKIKSAFVLSGMEDFQYHAGTLTLEPGDKIFQYTDGVTEATDANNQLYGMDRLEKILAENSKKTPGEILPAVKADIDKFVGEAPQFDDITMLCLEYRERMTEK